MDKHLSTSSFKWNLFFSALFVLVVVYLFSMGLGTIMKKVDSNDILGRSISENTFKYEGNEVLFIGDSRTHQGLDPRVFADITGEQAYNLGRPGLQAPFTYLILRDYVKTAKQKPEAIYVNYSFYLFGGMQWMHDIYFSYYTPTVPEVVDIIQSQLLTPVEAIKWYFKTRINYWRYKQSFTSMIKGILTSPISELKRINHVIEQSEMQYDHDSRGYYSRGSELVKEDKITDGSDYKKGIERGYSTYMDYIKRTFDLAQKHKIKLIVYQFPWPNATDNPVFAEVISYYQAMLEKEMAGNPYVSYLKDDYYWEPQYFSDPLHLNQSGAEKLTSKISEHFLSTR